MCGSNGHSQCYSAIMDSWAKVMGTFRPQCQDDHARGGGSRTDRLVTTGVALTSSSSAGAGAGTGAAACAAAP